MCVNVNFPGKIFWFYTQFYQPQCFFSFFFFNSTLSITECRSTQKVRNIRSTQYLMQSFSRNTTRNFSIYFLLQNLLWQNSDKNSINNFSSKNFRFPTQFYQSQLISPYPSSSITRTKNGSVPKTSKSSTASFMHNTIAFFLIDSVRTYAWLNANLAGKLLRKRSVTNSTTFQNSIRLFIKESVHYDTLRAYFIQIWWHACILLPGKCNTIWWKNYDQYSEHAINVFVCNALDKFNMSTFSIEKYFYTCSLVVWGCTVSELFKTIAIVRNITYLSFFEFRISCVVREYTVYIGILSSVTRVSIMVLLIRKIVWVWPDKVKRRNKSTTY